jgi:transcriptional regulator of heat shock response
MSTRVMVDHVRIDRRVFNIPETVRHGNERALVYALEKLARSMEHNNRTNLDMRFNSIESMADFVALQQHAHRQNRKPEIVWLTPEQKQTLLAEVDASMISSTDGQNVRLYGCLLRVEPV